MPLSRTNATVLVLAMGAFAIGTSEFAAMGLLPWYAGSFGVGEPAAGTAVTGYAFGVVAGAPAMILLGARVSRKLLLSLMMALFALGNLLGALSPTLTLFTASRVIAGLPHGAFLGLGMLFAASLFPQGKRALGAARVAMGLMVANIIGVPAASALGPTLGWRSGFVLVTLLAVATAVLLARVAPADTPDPDANPRRELAALRNRAVWLTLAVGAIGFGGIFAVYAYLSTTMLQIEGAPAWAIPAALSVFGVGATVGNWVSGRTSSWSRFGTALGFLAWLIAALTFYATAVDSWPLLILATLLVGGSGGLVVPLQMRLMDVAGEAQSMAAALNHAAFNLANGLGPLLAGITLEAGMGWQAPPLVGLGLASLGALALLVAFLDARRAARPEPHPAAA